MRPAGMPASRARRSSPSLTTSAPAPSAREQPQHRELVVRLHRVVDVRIEAGVGERPGEQAIARARMAGCRIHPDRRAHRIGDGVQRHVVDHQPVHRVHGQMRPCRDQFGGGGVRGVGGSGGGHARSVDESVGRIHPRIGDPVGRTRRRRRPLLAAGRHREQQRQQQRQPHASASRQRAAARATLAGAVPPKLVREATDASTVRTENTSAVMRGSSACSSASVRPARSTPRASARRHQPAGDVMGVAERQPQHPHQPVGEIGRGGEAGAGQPRASARGRPSCRAPCRPSRRATAPRRRRRRTPAPCPPACPWRRPAAGPSARSAAPTSAPMIAPGLGAHQLGRVGVALLRHDRAAGGEGVRQPDEAERRASTRSRSPRRGATGARREIAAARQELQREVAVRHGVERVGASAGRSPAPARSCARSIGNEVPASAAAPSGHSFSRRRQSANRPRSRPSIST